MSPAFFKNLVKEIGKVLKDNLVANMLWPYIFDFEDLTPHFLKIFTVNVDTLFSSGSEMAAFSLKIIE